MGKEKSEKRDKKEKKEKRSDTDGVKKSKKDKKSKLNGDNIAAAIEEVTKADAKPPAPTESEVMAVDTVGEVKLRPIGALVPFANPLADEKVTKKVLKGVKKGMAAFFFFLRRGLPLTVIRSCEEQDAQARSEGSCQGPAEISSGCRQCRGARNRHPRSRYFSHGRYLPHPGSMRRPQRTIHLRLESGRAGGSWKHETANKRSDGFGVKGGCENV